LAAATTSGLAIALGSNAINNLPAGLAVSATALQAHSPERVIDAMLIGVDLGPNLSITGSLATILWLLSIRCEGEEVDFMKFFKIGSVVMLPALVLAMGARLLIGHSGIPAEERDEQLMGLSIYRHRRHLAGCRRTH